jgi:hypothetical protein
MIVFRWNILLTAKNTTGGEPVITFLFLSRFNFFHAFLKGSNSQKGGYCCGF